MELINEDGMDIYFKDSSSIIKINSKDIMYVEIFNRKTRIVTKNGDHFSGDLIDEWQKRLADSRFYRIHKSYIVNIEYISEYRRTELVMTNGDVIRVSQINQPTFRKYFFEYLDMKK